MVCKIGVFKKFSKPRSFMFRISISETESVTFPIMFSKYRYLKTIGNCRYGVIIKAKNVQNNQFFACKILLRKYFQSNSDSSRSYSDMYSTLKMVEHESRIQHFLNHQNIVRNYETLYYSDFIVLVLDYCELGDLISYEFLKDLTIDKKILIMKDILTAIEYIHSKGIVHRDIKLDNILLCSNSHAKLSDFGCCESISENKTGKFGSCGTFEYMAPEVLQGNIKDLTKCDIWSFGIALFLFFFNFFPWSSESEDQLINEICNRRIEVPNVIPADLIAAIRACTEIDERLRPTASELLNFDVFKKFDLESHSSSSSESLTRSSSYFRMLEMVPKSSSQVFDKKVNQRASINIPNNRSFHHRTNSEFNLMQANSNEQNRRPKLASKYHSQKIKPVDFPNTQLPKKVLI